MRCPVRKMDISSSLTIGKGLLSHWRVTAQVGLETELVEERRGPGDSEVILGPASRHVSFNILSERAIG